LANSKKVKHLKDDRCRIIKIDKDALFEFIYETMIDNLKVYFDILDSTKVTSHHEFSSETGEYICLINDSKDKMPDDIDIKKLLSKMSQTTSSLYSDNRYKEISYNEIRTLLKKSDK
jgi:hypothetical protein